MANVLYRRGIQLSHWLNAGKRMLYLNRLCGLIFVGIGAMLLWEIGASM